MNQGTISKPCSSHSNLKENSLIDDDDKAVPVISNDLAKSTSTRMIQTAAHEGLNAPCFSAIWQIRAGEPSPSTDILFFSANIDTTKHCG